MTGMHDPPRLSDSGATPPDLSQWLQHAQGDGLETDAARRIAAKVAVQVGGPGGGAGPGGGLSRLMPRVVLGAVGAGTAAAVLWLGSAAWRGPSAPSPSPPNDLAQRAVPASATASVGVDAPGEEDTMAEASHSADEHAERPGAQPVVRPESPPARPAASGAASVTVAGVSSLAAEHRLLSAARKALATNPGRTLALAQEHAQRFPNGVLAQERDVLLIQALEGLGDHADAAKRAQDFEERYPDSPHRDGLGVGGSSKK